MNRYLLHIAWFDVALIKRNLTSLQRAMEYSIDPIDIVLVLNEQTFIDSPAAGEPKDMWNYFIDHPLIPKCTLIKITNNDAFTGVSRVRRDFRSKDGFTIWGESDTILPLEGLYIAETFHRQHKERPYVMTFATRKMWPGWELIEHPLFVDKSLDTLDPNIPEQDVMRFGGKLTEEWLYDFNDKQGDPEIILLPRPRIEGALTILSEGMPEPLLCPTQDFIGEDFCLQMAMEFYGIPQYHVKNILKGHDTANPNKRTNVSQEKIKHGYSTTGKERKEKEEVEMFNFIRSLYNSKGIKI